MSLNKDGDNEINSANPVARWIWISIAILLAVIAVPACLYNRSASPSKVEGENITRLLAGSSTPAVSQETEALGRSTSTPSEARPTTDKLSETQSLPPTFETAPADASLAPFLGGADKVAYLDANDIWIANLDGSNLTRLTNDGLDKNGQAIPGTGKSNLQWSADGQSVTYISDDKCFYRLHLMDRLQDRLVCFPFAEYFRAFEGSPDGLKVAISIDNWLYILPYDLALFNTIKSHANLDANAICEYFDPLEKDPDHRIVAKFMRWSADGQRLAFVTHSADRQVGDVSIVRVISYDDCKTTPRALSYFPAWHLLPDEYQKHPTLSNFGWDGKDLFAFIAVTDRETGFGGLFFYDTSLRRLSGPVDWIADCCYLDPSFSPDGSQVLFAYQAEPPPGAQLGEIRLYLVPVGEVGVQSTINPLPFPPVDPRSRPGAVLRQATAMPGQ